MKRIVLYVVTAMAVILAGCGKDLSLENSKGPGSGDTGTVNSDFHGLVNGQFWTATEGGASAVILNGEMALNGTSSDGSSLSILLTDTVVGSYGLSQTSFNVASYQQSSVGDAYTTNQSADTSNAGGSVIISTIDIVGKTISGTFYLNVYDSKIAQKIVISQGVINQLPYTNGFPPANGNDTFSAQINDTNWVAQSIGSGIVSGELNLQGSNQDGTRAIILYMPQGVPVGTYSLDVSTGEFYGEYIPVSTTLLVTQNNGTLTIIENNTSTKRVRGNFNFTATSLTGNGQSAQISNGYFSVAYP
jgi:hypothetical protein